MHNETFNHFFLLKDMNIDNGVHKRFVSCCGSWNLEELLGTLVYRSKHEKVTTIHKRYI